MSNKRYFLVFLALVLVAIAGYLNRDIIKVYAEQITSQSTTPQMAGDQQSTAFEGVEGVDYTVKTINKVPPKYMNVPDYSDIMTAAKILKQAINPEETEQWLKANASARVYREAAELAKLKAEKAKHDRDAVKFQAEMDAYKNEEINDKIVLSGIQASAGGVVDTSSLIESEAASEDDRIIRVTSYSAKSNTESSYAGLLIGDQEFNSVRQGQILLKNFTVQNLNDKTECVTLYDSKSHNTTTACFN